QYKYDGRNRLVEKKLPGKGWEYMVYDKQDRLVMTQDANMGSTKQWLFTKYDQYGRVAYTGIYTSSANYDGQGRASEQANVDSRGSNNVTRSAAIGFNNSNMNVYYDNSASSSYPNTITKLLSINYYDTYPSGSPAATNVFAQSLLTDNAANGISTKGLPLANYVKNIENDGWTRNYTWYDTKGRVIGTHSVNYLGGYTKTETLLDFAGIPQKTNTYHKRDGNMVEVQVKERFVYNAQNMLLKHYHQVDNNAEELLAENSYNEKSQLINKNVGNNLQSIDYAYNIRGWMTGINPAVIASMENKLFGYDIRYQNPTNTQLSSARYNGNISEVNWRTTANGILKRYAYQYDGLNRLTKGTFLNPDNAEPENKWNNETVDYDINGNITRLRRNAKSFYSGNAELIDDLVYEYSGNRLISVNDKTDNPTGYEGGGNPMEYDANGNMKTMPDKQIHTIGYNHLNLPNALRIEENKKKMIYLYRADGTKLRKTFNFLKQDGSVYTTITDYLDGFQYLSTAGNPPNELDPIEYAYEQESFIKHTAPNNPDPTLNFFPTAEGFYDYEKKEYIYQYKDHLGNVRVSYKKGNNGIEITDQNDYYPFGMNIPREGKAVFGTSSMYNYKYNGKELQETGMYDYGWRQYMPDIGRWGVVDPLAEQYRRWSPYNYAVSNPIRFIDPDGRGIEETTSGTSYTGADAQAAFRFLQSSMRSQSHPMIIFLMKKEIMLEQKKNNQPHRLVVENSKTKDRTNYSFADPNEDPKQIDRGIINKLLFVSEADIEGMLKGQGAFESGKFNFAWESQGGGDFDYSYSVLPNKYTEASSDPLNRYSNALFLPEGDKTAHNQMNFGNYLWGATGYTVGFDYSGLQMGAHANSKFNSRRNGYESQWDSKDDQRSIVLGAFHAAQRNYRAKRK
uniref:RHS repeat domain-containing protein n=1 Tax=Chryseobacterium taichungense TaxID=295069 RepID=UPI0028A6AB53